MSLVTLRIVCRCRGTVDDTPPLLRVVVEYVVEFLRAELPVEKIVVLADYFVSSVCLFGYGRKRHVGAGLVLDFVAAGHVGQWFAFLCKCARLCHGKRLPGSGVG